MVMGVLPDFEGSSNFPKTIGMEQTSIVAEPEELKRSS